MSPVAVASLVEIVEALADQITDAIAQSDIAGEALQVWPFLVLNPTPPTVDIYPADPFSEQIAYGPEAGDAWFTVRARVTPADIDASQQLLLALMDRRAATSVGLAIRSDKTLGGLVSNCIPLTQSGIIVYTPIGNEGYLVGCEWRVRVLL